MTSSTMSNAKRISDWQSWLMPSIEGIIGLFIFLMVLADGNRLFHDTDAGWHIATGNYILTNLEVPRSDIFSHRVYGQTWVAHEWLSDVIFAVLHRLFGFNGIIVLSAYLISTTFVILFKTLAARKLNVLIVTFVTILAAFTSFIHWLARPHLFSLFLTVIWHALLDKHQSQTKRSHYFLFPIVMVFWVNLHGGYVTAFALLGVYGLGNIFNCFLGTSQIASRRESLAKAGSLAAIGALCLTAALINPYGFRLLLFPFEILGAGDILPYIPEWQSISFREMTIYQVYFLLVVTTLLVARQRLDAVQLLLIVFAIHMFFSAKRYIPLFAILMAPLLGQGMNKLYQAMTKRRTSIAAFQFVQSRLIEFTRNLTLVNDRLTSRALPITLGLCAFVVIIAASHLPRLGFFKIEFLGGYGYAEKAVDFIQRNPLPPNMYNNYIYGGYLIYRLFPQPSYRVFMDGRAVVGGTEYFTEYQQVDWMTARWSKILEKYQVQWIMEIPNTHLSIHLLTDPEWKLIYADKAANIFIRNTPANQAIIENYKNVKPVAEDLN